jgi:hypothetical protein
MLKKIEDGIGIIDTRNLHIGQVNSLKHTSTTMNITSHLHPTVSHTDVHHTPLNLPDPVPQQMKASERPKKEKKTVHGRQAYDLETQRVNKITFSRGNRLAKLSPETNVFTIAMQDQVISASNYKQYILKDQNATAIYAHNADSNVKPFNIHRCMSCTSPRRLQPTSLSSGQHCSSRIVYQMGTVNAIF